MTTTRKKATPKKASTISKADEKKAEEKVDPELNFTKYKEVEVEILKSKRIIADRIDTATDLRRLYRDFHGEWPEFSTVMEMVDLVRALCDQMLERCEALTFEDMSREEFVDPYADLMPKNTECADDDDLLVALVSFKYCRPFAERLLNAHRLVLEDIEAAGK